MILGEVELLIIQHRADGTGLMSVLVTIEKSVLEPGQISFESGHMLAAEIKEMSAAEAKQMYMLSLQKTSVLSQLLCLSSRRWDGTKTISIPCS